MVLRKWKDWNASFMWFHLINIYDCRRKLNKANGVILNSLWSWSAGLTTNSEARGASALGMCDFSFLHFPLSFFMLSETSNADILECDSNSSHLSLSAYFLCICDWMSEGRSKQLPKDVNFGTLYKIVILGVSRVCVCHVLILCRVWWHGLSLLATESWQDRWFSKMRNPDHKVDSTCMY
jgi:hypothetical protein